MRPDRVDFLFLLDSCFREAEVLLLDVGEGSEDISFDHLHHVVQVRDDQRSHELLLVHHLLQVLESVEPVSLEEIVRDTDSNN